MNASLHPIDTWHRIVRSRDPRALADWLDDEVVFLSPVVHTPQRGRAITTAYLAAAIEVFGQPGFRYVREIRGDRSAVLEFEVTIDGVEVNGVDLITWNDAGRVVEFKVMVRPLKGMQMIHQRMGEMLARAAAKP